MSWPTVRLGDVCEIQRGGSPRPINEFLTDSADGLNWIKIGDVDPSGKYILSTEDKIKPVGLKKTRAVSAGEFLLSNSMSFGRPYILKIAGCIHDGWLVLRGFRKTFTEDYFYYLLRSPGVQCQFEKYAHGSTVRNLNTEAVSKVVVPVVDMAEQKKIVERVEKALVRVDAMRAQFERTAKAADNYFKATLAETFDSRTAGDCISLEDASELIADCPHTTAKEEGAGYPLVRTPNIGLTRLNYVGMHRVSKSVYDLRTVRGVPESGDLILAREAPAGNVAVIQDGETVCLGQRTVLIKPKKELFDPDYLAWFILSPKSQKTLLGKTSGATVQHLNVSDIRAFMVSLQDSKVQREVVEIINAAKAKSEQIAAVAKRGIAICDKMRKAILAEAFS